jgi:hypothetical protein
MKKIIALTDVVLRELAESILRWIKKYKLFFGGGTNQDVISELRKEGVSVIENFLSDEECDVFVRKIEKFIDKESTNVWKDAYGGDSRIYFSEQLDVKFKKFYESPKIRDVLYAYTGIKKPVGMLLASKIKYVKDGAEGSGGGWHRDSPVSHQFKAICYLNDVDSFNGPFQYIKGSHRKLEVIVSYLKGVFYPKQYRFSSDDVENYLETSNKKITEVLGKKGTLAFADTKGIHTGKPLLNGERYVLFCYFWDGKIPEHFKKLKQN